MFYSTPTRYALRGLTELALRATEGGRGMMRLDRLVCGTDLPFEFMGKVFQRLVKAKILASAKGRGGGFALARSPDEITLLEVLQAMEGQAVCRACVLGLKTCDDAAPCPQHDLYKPIRHRLIAYLQSTTIADMVASARQRPGAAPPARAAAPARGNNEPPSA